MEWDRLLATDRLGREGEPSQPRPGRSQFESDVGRITFSSAFRRLGRKTQVHPLAPNDHVHTRLTHSAEVAYVGRALGKELGTRITRDLPSGIAAEDLGTVVHAACLAHDLGNPPFGHGGEEGVIHWFETNGPRIFKDLTKDHRQDLISFEGKSLGRQKVYTDIKKVEMEIGCYAIFDTLLTEFCEAALNQAAVLNDKAKETTLSWKTGHLMQMLGDHGPTLSYAPPGGWSQYQCLRRVIDFVSGMTDNYAVYLSGQFRGMAFAGMQRP